MASNAGYSANVVLTLWVDGLRLALSHVGPGSVAVREPCVPIPPSRAKIVIEVDNATKTLDVFLPHGIPSAPQRVSYI